MSAEPPFIVIETLTKLSPEQREELRSSGVFKVWAKVHTENPPGRVVRLECKGAVLSDKEFDEAVSIEAQEARSGE